MAQQIDYVSLLSGLSDSDSERRKQAEECYNNFPAKDRFSFLGIALCQKDLPEPARIFAAILLRRLILNNWTDILGSIPQEQLKLSCNQFLKVLQESVDESREIREKTSQVVAAIARSFLPDANQVNPWGEFVQYVFELLRSQRIELRESGFTILSSDPDVLGQQNNQPAYFEQVYACFVENLNQKGQQDRFYLALIGAIAGYFVANSTNKEAMKRLSNLAGPMVEHFKNVQDDSIKEEICQHLIEIAEEAPVSLRPAITQIMELCLYIMTQPDSIDSNLRYSALELMVSIIENAPQMVKKRAANYIKPIVLRVLGLMSEIDDEPDWYTSCTNEKDEDDPDSVGETALDRISNSIGGKVLLPILMDELTKMLSKPEWQARHAALMAFSCAGEGCRDQLMKIIDKVVNGIMSFLNDPHPRVRHAACNAIGQMATDFSPEFEIKFHAQVIPSLCRLLVDSSQRRVQAHAASAMINFYEECSQDILINYLDMITEHIQQALSQYMTSDNALTFITQGDESQLFVVENIIVALSSVADSSAESFAKYYEKFMPCLKYIISNAAGKDQLRVLRGKAIECVSLIGMAVGKELFFKDASDIMMMLLATQTGNAQLADDDPQLSYMMAAWARICRIMGPEFKTYLPYVMPPVLQAAALKVEIALLNDDDRASIENSSDWESVSVQDQTVGIRTAGLEDKATACSMLVCYARELKHGFVDYVQQTAEVLIPLLKFPFHDDVRCAAAEAMPYLLESAQPLGEGYVHQLWGAIFDGILGALNVEAEISVQNQLLESLGSCIEVVGAKGLSAERLDNITAKLIEKFQQHFEYLEEEFDRRKDEDYEAESEASDDDEDSDCLAGISAVIHSLCLTAGPDYLASHFAKLVEFLAKLSVESPYIPWTNRHTALCIWDDVIEYGQLRSADYRQFFMPLLSGGVVDKNKEIRQAAMYGVGQLAERHCASPPEPKPNEVNNTMNNNNNNNNISVNVNPQPILAAYLEYFQALIPNICKVIGHHESRSEDYIMATENGIAAVCRILKHWPQLHNHHELLKCWLNWLPIWEDSTEVPVVMDYLLRLIESNNPTVMGEPLGSNLPKLVAIVAETFARSAIEASSQVGSQMVLFLKQVHANPATAACLQSLTSEQQKAAQEVLALS